MRVIKAISKTAKIVRLYYPTSQNFVVWRLFTNWLRPYGRQRLFLTKRKISFRSPGFCWCTWQLMPDCIKDLTYKNLFLLGTNLSNATCATVTAYWLKQIYHNVSDYEKCILFLFLRTFYLTEIRKLMSVNDNISFPFLLTRLITVNLTVISYVNVYHWHVKEYLWTPWRTYMLCFVCVAEVFG